MFNGVWLFSFDQFSKEHSEYNLSCFAVDFNSHYIGLGDSIMYWYMLMVLELLAC